MIRCITNEMREEFINSVSLAFSPLKHSLVFRNIYSGDIKDIIINDKYNNAIELIKIVEPELILDAIYRGNLLGLRGKSVKEICDKIYNEITSNAEKYSQIDLSILCKYNKYIKLSLIVNESKLQFYIIYGNKAISVELKNVNVTNGVSNLMAVKFFVLPNMQCEDIDNYVIQLEYIYTPDKEYKYPIDIKYGYNSLLPKEKLLAKHFDIMEDIIMDAQVYNDKYSDEIYMHCISKVSKEFNDIFSERGNMILCKHNINPYIIKGFNKEFNGFIIENVLNLKYGNRILDYRSCLYHNTYKADNFYCIDVKGDIDSDNNVYNIKLLEITDGKCSFKSLDAYLKEYNEVYYGEFISYYNIMDIMESYITWIGLDRSKYVNVYYSPVFIESYVDEIKKWNNKVYYLNNGRKLFWCDDFSKMEGVINDEEFISKQEKQ